MKKLDNKAKNSGGGRYFIIQKNKKAFTLVELLITITILVILATIGFLSFGDYTKDARDSVRYGDLKNIKSAMDFKLTKGGDLPIPDNVKSELVQINGIDGVNWREGEFGEENFKEFEELSNLPLDPKEKTKYKYFLTENGEYYYLETELESGKKYFLTNYEPENLALNSAPNNPTPNPIPTPVQQDKDIYNPIGQTINTIVGNSINAGDGIQNKQDLPATTTYRWKTPSNNANPGNSTGIIEVVYPDNSIDEVIVNIESSCGTGQHQNGNTCESNTKSCDIMNGGVKVGTGNQTWNTGTNSWNTCQVTSCNTGYSLVSGQCVVPTPVCNDPIYLHTNGVTIKAKDCAVGGQEYIFNSNTYYVAIDRNDLKNKINSGYTANRIVTSKVTNMDSMFYDNRSFNQDISNWDTSKVTNMSGMFTLAWNFNQPLNNWDVSRVTNMSDMFLNAGRFNQPLNNWDTSKVINMSGMFSLAWNFNKPLNNWNVSNVTNMGHMFYSADLFNQSLNNWDVSSVTDMYNMFSRARSFNQNINSWNVSNVTNMGKMFSEALSFNQPLNNWNVSNVTDMRSMFSFASNFNQPLNNWDVSKVTHMGGFDFGLAPGPGGREPGIFEGATKFNQNLSNWNTTSIENGNCNNFAPHLSASYKPEKCKN